MKVKFSFDWEIRDELILEWINSERESLREEAISEGMAPEHAEVLHPNIDSVSKIGKTDLIEILFNYGAVDDAFDNISYNDICIS